MKYIAIFISIMFFIITILYIFTAKSKAGNIYDEYISFLDEKKYKLKKYIPIGLYINQYRNYNVKFLPTPLYEMLGRYKLALKALFFELEGAKYGEYYYTIYEGEKKIISLIVELAVSFFSFLCAVQDDISSSLLLIVGGSVFSVLILFLLDQNINKKIQERQMKIRIDFPEFVNKLSLLINAGMTVGSAWEKICLESKVDTPLYNEAKIAYYDMKNGLSEARAIESFGRRCKTKEILKFTSILIANVKKGGAEIVPILMQQSEECWDMRKSVAREMGAKAGVKMMIPMVLLLLAVIIVVGAPAVMMMNSI